MQKEEMPRNFRPFALSTRPNQKVQTTRDEVAGDASFEAVVVCGGDNVEQQWG